jgi:hypothetical protein
MAAGQPQQSEAAFVAPGEGPPRLTRPPEMEDWLNSRIFHPLAHRLALALARTPVTPNAVSLAGGACIVAAGLLYTRLPSPHAVLLGLLAHLAWHVLDGADGELARRTGRASPIGELVDGAADYLGHLLLYILLAFWLDDMIGSWAYAVATAAGLCRIVQSNQAESQRRIYLWRVYDVPWLKQTAGKVSDRPNLFARLAAPVGRGYVALADALSPRTAPAVRIIEQALRDPATRERARSICRREGRTTLRLQMALGSNPRTLMLGASMAAGSPLWFFLAELSLMNLLLIVSMRRQARCDWRIAAELERALPSPAGRAAQATAAI